MKRDLKINYGILDGIIEQLHTYKNALDTMHSSLETLVSFIRNNYAESIDAWDDLVKDSKKHIKDYQTQIGDLLSLFEGYVDDTTAYISPIARNSMMRVDRNDIWANLCQVESGITNNVPKALSQANRVPSDLFNWDDPTDEEKASSRANKAKMEYIQAEIQTTKNILDKKMDSLWNLYDNKIVPFENTDDAYNDKAADVKDKYTDFFEAVADALSGIGNAVASFVEGLVDGIVDIVVGLVTIIIEAGIVAISNQIPDFAEPDILKDKANEIKDKYSEMVVNAVEDPFSILESLGQGVTDTAEEEGIMYIAGNVSTSFIPYVGVLGKAKWLKAVDNGNGPKTKPVSDGIQAKVKDLVNNNKAFEGIKNGAIEFVSGVRNGANIFINGLLRPNSINDRLAPAGVPSGINVPWNVLDNKTIQDHIVAPLKMAIDRVNGGGKGDKSSGGNGNQLTRLYDEFGSPLPYGFKSIEDYNNFVNLLKDKLPEDTQIFFQGSSVTGVSYKKGLPFDQGRTSDFDIALVNDDLFLEALEIGREGGYKMKTDPNRIGPLERKQLEELKLYEIINELSEEAGRPVSFMLYESVDQALRRPSLMVTQ